MWAKDIDKALKPAPDSKVETLVNATREQVRAALDAIAKQAQPQDALVLMLIGHGSFDGFEYKMNLSGPDLSAAELATLLDRIPATRQLLVDMTSSSGGAIEALRKSNRVIITATKNGSEKNATVFARYWVEALSDPAADSDKNDVVSALEAFRFADKRSVKDVLMELSRRPQVMLAEPHYIFTLSDDAAKLEPSKAEALPVEKSADTSPPSYAAALLRLRGAHKIATGRGVRVAVIDSLIDRAHPEIEGSIAENFDALGDASAPPHKHGTGMASAIVGHRQIEGAAPAAQILAVRAFSETDGATRAVGLDILAGFDWAVRQKAQVINMSFAGPIDPLLGKMLAAAASRRIVMIAAAGNEGPRAAPLYPAADAHVVAVSAVDERTQIYVNDNRGPYIALAAPGVDVLVAAPRAAYDLTTGTSVACAEVSGIAALVLEEKPNLDGPALRRLLQDTAHAFDGVTGAGAGIADAQAAVERVR